MKDRIVATLENSRTYSLSVAEVMPESSYHFKPTGAGWDFGELLHHIAYGIQWWEDTFLKGNQPEWNPFPAKGNKQAIIAYLNQAYDSLAETLDQQPLTPETMQGFHATLDHITHHRGQAVLYLRCRGIIPPEYTY